MQIKIDLSADSLSKALDRLEGYRKKVSDADETIVQTLTESGTEQAKEFAMYMNAYDSGALVNGIVGRTFGKTGEIAATAPHSAVVEFGTGVMGKGSQHPNPGLAGWKYDVNNHGESGWWYLGDDGEWHWTKGMPSRPYMYDTAQILRESIPYVAKEVIDDD